MVSDILNEDRQGCFRAFCMKRGEYTAWLSVGRKDGEPGRGYFTSDMKVCGDHRYTTTLPMFLEDSDKRDYEEMIERAAREAGKEPVMPDWDTVDLEWRAIQ